MTLHETPQGYPAGRRAVYAANGMVCTGQPLAAQAGLAVLQRGGNAVDAAVAAAAALTVAEPTANGIGGDAFALVWKDGRLYGLNSSGPAPALLSIDELAGRAADGTPAMATFGWEPVTVPGAPAAWAALSGRFGSLPFADVLSGAIRLADDGYPVSPVCSRYWAAAATRYREVLADPLFDEWFRVFTRGGGRSGATPRPGELWRMPDHAETLRSIADSQAESFYRGKLADAIDRHSRTTGGFIRAEDLRRFEPEWVQPISLRYRGYDIWEIPPNGQGMVALSALGALAGDNLGGMDPAVSVHLQIEALKLAFADAAAYITEEDRMPHTPAELLAPGYLARRRSLIGTEAGLPAAGTPERGGTVYLATADASGTMVSYIQSNYMGFGSGLVVPGTGIALHNRGKNFSTTPGHPNVLEPGKRPYHTIIPGFLSRDGKAVGPFGVMGGFMQPQGHVQVMVHTLDEGLEPQAALDAPRFVWLEGRKVMVEPDYDPTVVSELRSRGHEIDIATDPGAFGRGQSIWRTDDGVLVGATEKRTDGCVAGY